MKIAIIGSGISGLLVAYYLSLAGKNVTIFEKSDRIGGNCQTVKVRINSDAVRWVDLGVNDFNAETYTNLVKILDTLQVPYKPLEDSCSFSTPDGSYAYTIEPDGTSTMPKYLQEEYERFKREAPQDVLNPAYQNFSIAKYLEAKGYNPEFGRYNLYPRINGMYFVHDTTPETMPFRAIMNYYLLQEGFGSKARRMYFANGSSSWVQALANKIQFLGAQIYTKVSVQISTNGDRTIVHTPDGYEEFDAVVLACHADTALRVIRRGITEDMVDVLSSFTYCNSIAVAHTDTSLMPQDVNSWRTYNILIRDQSTQLRPYSISYVGNRHQNDAKNPVYDSFDTSKFFVTLNPCVPIPNRHVLRTVYSQDPAIAYFQHNVVNLASMAAQEKLPKIQGQNNIFFTGGWTNGAGLQEECWYSAYNVASLILGSKAAENQQPYNPAVNVVNSTSSISPFKSGYLLAAQSPDVNNVH